jgi:hypothetical protein
MIKRWAVNNEVQGYERMQFALPKFTGNRAMKAMNTMKQHQKMLLAGDGDCGVVLCPECNLLELNLGAATVRIRPESLALLGSLIKSAEHRLTQVQQAANGNTQSIRMRHFH